MNTIIITHPEEALQQLLSAPLTADQQAVVAVHSALHNALSGWSPRGEIRKLVATLKDLSRGSDTAYRWAIDELHHQVRLATGRAVYDVLLSEVLLAIVVMGLTDTGLITEDETVAFETEFVDALEDADTSIDPGARVDEQRVRMAFTSALVALLIAGPPALMCPICSGSVQP